MNTNTGMNSFIKFLFIESVIFTMSFGSVYASQVVVSARSTEQVANQDFESMLKNNRLIFEELSKEASECAYKQIDLALKQDFEIAAEFAQHTLQLIDAATNLDELNGLSLDNRAVDIRDIIDTTNDNAQKITDQQLLDETRINQQAIFEALFQEANNHANLQSDATLKQNLEDIAALAQNFLDKIEATTSLEDLKKLSLDDEKNIIRDHIDAANIQGIVVQQAFEDARKQQRIIFENLLKEANEGADLQNNPELKQDFEFAAQLAVDILNMIDIITDFDELNAFDLAGKENDIRSIINTANGNTQKTTDQQLLEDTRINQRAIFEALIKEANHHANLQSDATLKQDLEDIAALAQNILDKIEATTDLNELNEFTLDDIKNYIRNQIEAIVHHAVNAA